MNVTIIPCLTDNYAYLIESQDAVAIVDPSEAGPVLAALAERGRTLTHILNTHHHFDHTGGNQELRERTGAKVYGPKADAARIPALDHGLSEGDTITLGKSQARILEIPAHTSGHIAFWFEDAKAVFTGDTMFAMGCGRLFEGTPAQMWASLLKLSSLPGETQVYCGHEYTHSNGRFALTVDKDNQALVARMHDVEIRRKAGRPTIPSTIALERATNPFLRAREPDIAAALGLSPTDPIAVFAELRQRKDRFK